MRWELIESDAALAQLLARTAHCDAVMVDTEFMRRDTFFPQVALLQLCFAGDEGYEETAWLIDPLAITDTSALAALLENPRVLKVLHSASEDLEVFSRWLDVLPQPLFDTQRAAALLDRGFGLGYRALVEAVCDVDLPKGETRSNWLQRPLTESQCEYAAMDVTWLLPVWRDLYADCQKRGRLDWVLADGVDATAAMGSVQGDWYRRIKSAWKLDQRALGRLEAICQWREDEARRRDRPRSWIIDDNACFRIAAQGPTDDDSLRDALDVPPKVFRRYASTLLEVLDEAAERPEDALPERLPPPLDAGQRTRLKSLKSRAKSLARSLGVAPEILLSGKDYELLLREAEGHVVAVPAPFTGWRADAVVAPLRAFLREGR